MEVKKELIQIRVTGKQKEEIKKLAKQKGMNISELLLYSVMKVITEDNLKHD